MRIIPFRGEYYELTLTSTDLIRGMVYPVPDPRYPFLGVHFTRGLDGKVHVGPNAVLALALEGYRWRQVSARDSTAMLRWPGFWRMAAHNWRAGAGELSRSLSKHLYLKAARRYLPMLQPHQLTRAPAGVRAQAVGRDGRLIDDFVIEERDHVVLIRNAPSPAATASLAIAERIAGEAFRW
jgi:L-2-hydroxyglutarate oxidase LhgO